MTILQMPQIKFIICKKQFSTIADGEEKLYLTVIW